MENIIAVEPEIPENTGFLARLAANYSVNLRIVNPEFNLKEARKSASSCQGKLRDAEIFDTVENTVEGLDFVVGTKPGKGIPVKDFEPRDNTSVMLGRESDGLSNRELELCDAVVHLDLPGYSSMNLSHAAAAILQEFSESSETGMTQKQRDKIQELAPGEVGKALIRSNPSKTQAGEIIAELMEDS